MELDSRFVGTLLHPLKTKVDWRTTTNYAAATGDDNPRYLDDQNPDGQVAPPMLAVALTWPISANLGNFLPAGDFPSEVLLTQVHYTERLDFHRPVRPGDQLTINGQLVSISPHRAGTHSIVRYEASDQKGRPVFTEHIGVMLRGVKCIEGGDRLDIPLDPIGDWAAGPLWSERIRIDPLLPYIYDGCTDIVFAIHTSPAFAARVGLPGIILQGSCTLALAVRELLNREAGGDPARLRTLSCRFSGMVRPGTDIQVNLRAKDREEYFFDVINQEGKKAISKGYAKIR